MLSPLHMLLHMLGSSSRSNTDNQTDESQWPRSSRSCTSTESSIAGFEGTLSWSVLDAQRIRAAKILQHTRRARHSFRIPSHAAITTRMTCTGKAKHKIMPLERRSVILRIAPEEHILQVNGKKAMRLFILRSLVFIECRTSMTAQDMRSAYEIKGLAVYRLPSG